MKRILGSLALTVMALIVGSCGGSSPAVCSLDGGQPLATTAWPKFRADLANTGQSAVDLTAFPSGNLEKVWTFQTGGAVSSSAAIGPITTGTGGEIDYDIYIGSADAKIYSIGNDGNMVWQGLTNNTITSAPALDSAGNIFIASNDGSLYTLVALTGVEARNSVGIGGVLASPTVAGAPNAGVVYVSSILSGVFAICPNDILRWASNIVPVSTTPAIDEDGNVYVTGTNDSRSVASLSAFNGAQNWIFTTTAAINASPVLGSDGTVYAIDSRGRLFGIDPDTGTSPGVIFDASKQTPGAQVFASPALSEDGTLYIVDTAGEITAVDPVNGVVNWHVSIGAAIYSSPLITADKTLIFGADDGVIYAFADRGASAELRWTFQTRDDLHPDTAVRSSPALANDGLGTIYIGASDGLVYALRPPSAA